MKSRAAAERHDQNEQVVTFTLVEFLTALVFIAMALGLILRSEALRDLDPDQEKMQHLRTQLAERDRRIRDLTREVSLLQAEIEAQRSLVRRLMSQAGMTLPPDEHVVLSRADYDRIRNAVLVSRDQQSQIADLLRQIAALRGGGGTDLPRCTTNPGMLISIRLNGDGSFSAAPAWPAESSAAVSQIDGLSDLISAGAMTRATFLRHASRVDAWGERQALSCAFNAVVTRGHGNLDLYLRQLSAVEQHFYVRRAR
ncbi:hypothetical protein ACFQRC_07305 [Enterovirga sp. GCM10030262]|uniref:hypothetical protein n=1 Tax=Enterovirga sp. GCM10030262 TaxID=3273391 RepID=UPI003619D447